LYEKLGTRTLYEVAHRTVQVSRTRNMADDRDDKEFQFFFFRKAVYVLGQQT